MPRLPELSRREVYRARYLPAQRKYQARVRPLERADVVVVNERPAAPRLIVREGVRLPGA